MKLTTVVRTQFIHEAEALHYMVNNTNTDAGGVVDAMITVMSKIQPGLAWSLVLASCKPELILTLTLSLFITITTLTLTGPGYTLLAA